MQGMALLTPSERGIYNSILDLLYCQDGILKDDDERVARAISVHQRTYRTIKARLIALGKVWVRGDLIEAKRVVKTLKEADEFRIKGSKRAYKRWQKSKNINKINGTSMQDCIDKNMVPTPTPTPTPTKKDSVLRTDADASLNEIKIELFGPFLIWLAASNGRDPNRYRSLVGKMIRDHGPAKVLAAYHDAQKKSDPPVDRVSYVTSLLKPKSKTPTYGTVVHSLADVENLHK